MTPIAIGATGSGLREGQRNPAVGSARHETVIIARTGKDVYGTRQSNLGAGGAAIYGCRTTADFNALSDTTKSTPCLRANNLSDGLIYSYRFATGGVAGVYQAGASATNDPQARPFITNATGIATGLNADRVDSLQASDIIAAIRATGVGPQGPKGPAGDKGATGLTGPPGIPGLRGQWYTGPAPPAQGTPADAQPNDYFLDVTDPGVGDVYRMNSNLIWDFDRSIKGPEGDPLSLPQQAVQLLVENYCDANNHCDFP